MVRISGYDHSKNWIQANTIKIFLAMLGADQARFSANWHVVEQRVQPLLLQRSFRYSVWLDAPPCRCRRRQHPARGHAVLQSAAGWRQERRYKSPFLLGLYASHQLDHPGLIGSFTVRRACSVTCQVSRAITSSLRKRKVIGVGVKFDYQKKFSIDIGC